MNEKPERSLLLPLRERRQHFRCVISVDNFQVERLSIQLARRCNSQQCEQKKRFHFLRAIEEGSLNTA